VPQNGKFGDRKPTPEYWNNYKCSHNSLSLFYDHPDLTTPLLVIMRVGGGEEEDPLLL
jgi:hypothetical protein